MLWRDTGGRVRVGARQALGPSSLAVASACLERARRLTGRVLLKFLNFRLAGSLARNGIDITVIVLVTPSLLRHRSINGRVSVQVFLVEYALFDSLEDLEGANYGPLLAHMDPLRACLDLFDLFIFLVELLCFEVNDAFWGTIGEHLSLVDN